MPPSPAYDLFVSYVDADRAWVEGYLLNALEHSGVRYHCETAFALGVPRIMEFEHAIRQSRRTLLVLSPAYLIGPFIQFADLLAQTYGLETGTWRVIPLILHPVSLPSRLSMLTALDATNGENWSTIIERLCIELHRPVPGPAPKPPCPYPGLVPFSEKDALHFYGREREIDELRRRLRHQNLLFVIGPSGSGKSSLVFAGLVPELQRQQPGRWLVKTMRPGGAPLEALEQILAGAAQPSINYTQCVAAALAQGPATRRLLLIIDQFEELFTQTASVDRAAFMTAIMSLCKIPNCVLVPIIRADFYEDLMSSDLWPIGIGQRLEVAPLRGAALCDAITKPAEDLGVYLETELLARLLADTANEPGVLPLMQETMGLLWEKMERRLLSLSAYERLGDDNRSGLTVAIATKADATLAILSNDQQAIARRIFVRLVQFGEGRADTRRQQPVRTLRTHHDDPLLFDQTLRHLVNNRLLTLSGEERQDSKRVDLAHEALISGWPQFRQWLAERRDAEQTRRQLEAKVAEWMRLGKGRGGLLDEAELPEAERWLGSTDAIDLGYSEALALLVQTSRSTIEQAEQAKEVARRHELEQAQALAIEQQRVADEQRQRAELERQRAEEQTRTTKRLGSLVAMLAILVLLAAAATIFATDRQRIARQEADTRATAEIRAVEQQHFAQEAAVRSATAEANARAQKGTAEENANKLETQLQIADAQRLALAAQSLVREAPETALLLVYEAASLSRNGVTEKAVHDVLNQIAWQPIQLGDQNIEIQQAIFSPDGQAILTISTDKTARVWNLLGKLVVTFQHADDVETAIFTPDSRAVFTSSADGTVRLWDLTGKVLVNFKGHTALVHSVILSPDGQQVLTTSEDKTARLWDRTGKSLAIFRHPDAVSSATFSPDARRILTTSNRSVYLWSLEGQSLATFEGYRASFSPDGKTILTQSYPGGLVIRTLTGRVLFTIPTLPRVSSTGLFSPDGQHLLVSYGPSYRSGGETAMGDIKGHYLTTLDGFVTDFSPDGKHILTASEQGSAQLWDSNGKPLGSFEHPNSVVNARFSPDGQRILTTSGDGDARLWDSSGQLLLIFQDGERLSHASFSPDGNTVLTLSENGTARLWDTKRPHLEFPIQMKALDSATVSPDGRKFLAGSKDSPLQLLDINGAILASLEDTNATDGAVFSPDSNKLITCSSIGIARLWDMAGQQLGTFPNVDSIDSVMFSPDSTKILTISRVQYSMYSIAQIWDLTGQLLFTLKEPIAPSENLIFSPNSQFILTVAWDHQRLWNLAGQLLVTFGDIDKTESASFSPDSQHILTLSKGIVRLWDLTGKNLATLQHTDTVSSASFSPDSQHILTLSQGNVQLWDLTGKNLATLQHTDIVSSASFSPDSQYILTLSKGIVRLWDLAGENLTVIQNSVGDIHRATFSADGTRILTLASKSLHGSTTSPLRLWNLRGEALALFPDQRSAVFSSDGTRILAINYDGMASQYLVNISDLLAIAACRVGRGLSEEEIERYHIPRPLHFDIENRQCPPAFSWQK